MLTVGGPLTPVHAHPRSHLQWAPLGRPLVLGSWPLREVLCDQARAPPPCSRTPSRQARPSGPLGLWVLRSLNPLPPVTLWKMRGNGSVPRARPPALEMSRSTVCSICIRGQQPGGWGCGEGGMGVGRGQRGLGESGSSEQGPRAQLTWRTDRWIGGDLGTRWGSQDNPGGLMGLDPRSARGGPRSSQRSLLLAKRRGQHASFLDRAPRVPTTRCWGGQRRRLPFPLTQRKSAATGTHVSELGWDRPCGVNESCPARWGPAPTPHAAHPGRKRPQQGDKTPGWGHTEVNILEPASQNPLTGPGGRSQRFPPRLAPPATALPVWDGGTVTGFGFLPSTLSLFSVSVDGPLSFRVKPPFFL